jgi:large subunit ribosomal protein L21
MSYAIISVGGKQHRVREGEKLLVERLGVDEGKTFEPPVLMLGGDGEPDLSPKAGTVTVRVVGHVLGDKVRIGKYRRRTGYRRHAGHRSKLTQIQVESIGATKARKPAARKPAAEKKDTAASAEKPKRTPARKPAATKKTTEEKKDGA